MWGVESNPTNPLGLVAHTWSCEGARQGLFSLEAWLERERRRRCVTLTAAAVASEDDGDATWRG